MRIKANNVTYAGEKLRLKKAKPSSGWSLAIVAVFYGLLAMFYWQQTLHRYVLYAYVGLTLLTFLAYWLDKHKAQTGRGHNRTPESTLHLFALMGGWPGALLAQDYLRHKSSKRSFQTVFWITVLLNIAAFFWVSSQGLML